MRAACARAQVLDIIERQPQGFETPAGERGRLFSGGERQRLAIARAILKDPPILILDEATSALDAITEAKVQAALAEVMKGRTTFVIAHRLATIRNGRILAFDNARIIEMAPRRTRSRWPAELAKTQFCRREQFAAKTETVTEVVTLSRRGSAVT
jgi:ATP-binding cassette subfamily B protein